MGFWANERYTSIDLSPTLTKLSASGMEIFGIYGKEDGLYSSEQIEYLKRLLGNANVVYQEGASHSVFIDRQTDFIEAINRFTGQKD
jgi:proline iminopeptidase